MSGCRCLAIQKSLNAYQKKRWDIVIMAFNRENLCAGFAAGAYFGNGDALFSEAFMMRSKILHLPG